MQSVSELSCYGLIHRLFKTGIKTPPEHTKSLFQYTWRSTSCCCLCPKYFSKIHLSTLLWTPLGCITLPYLKGLAFLSPTSVSPSESKQNLLVFSFQLDTLIYFKRRQENAENSLPSGKPSQSCAASHRLTGSGLRTSSSPLSPEMLQACLSSFAENLALCKWRRRIYKWRKESQRQYKYDQKIFWPSYY